MNHEILTAIQTLFPPDSVIELRIPAQAQKQGTISGYFDNPQKLAESIEKRSGSYTAIYYTLNPTNPALLARSSNQVVVRAPATTADTDVTRRQWLLIDVDPVRPSGISSSDAEKELALNKAKEVHSYLTAQGWPKPITADSGNGYHMLYRLDLPNTKEVTEAVKAVLKFLADKFDDETVNVDKTVFNAARITKAYGSMVCKGQNLPDRPHRQSKLRSTDGGKEPVSLGQLKDLAGLKLSGLKISAPVEKNGKSVSMTPEKVEEFLAFYGIEHRDRQTVDSGYKWTLVNCPFNPEHAKKDSAVFITDGKLGFNCFHNHCADNHWKELRAFLETEQDKKFWFADNVAEVASSTAPSTSELCLESFSEVKAEIIDWLWKGKIPFGKLTLFAGHPGVGKGCATIAVASCVSTGMKFPDAPNSTVGDVLICSSEDAASDTLKPRLMAWNANMDRVHNLKFVKSADGERQFSLDADLPALRQTLLKHPQIKLVIIDPIMNHLGEINANKDQEIRKALMPLAYLANEFKIAVVVVAHLNKKENVEAITKVGGSMGLVGSVRSAWLFKYSSDDPDARVMIPLKMNNAASESGLAYDIGIADIEIDGKPVEIAKIYWGGVTYEQANSPVITVSNPTKTAACIAWIKETLADGKQSKAKLIELGIIPEYSKGTINRALASLKSSLQVNYEEEGFGKDKQTVWFLTPPKESKESKDSKEVA